MSETQTSSPWSMKSINDFQYFNCPGCEFKHQSKQEFINHANELHPESIEHLEQMEDLDGVLCPWKKSKFLKTKSHQEFYNKTTLEKIKKRDLKQFHWPCEFCDFTCLTLKGLLQHNEGAHEGFHETITKIHEANYGTEDIFDFSSIAMIPLLPVPKSDGGGGDNATINQNTADESTEDFDHPMQDEPWANDEDNTHDSPITLDDYNNDFVNSIKARPRGKGIKTKEGKDNNNPMEMKENMLPTTPQFRHILPKENIPTPKIRDILPSLAPSEGKKLKEYECDKCGKKLHSKKNLENHNILIHPPETDPSAYIFCDKCPAKFLAQQKSKLEYHHKEKHEPKSEQCQQCGKMFHFARRLRMHIKSAHGGKIEPKYQCDQCAVMCVSGQSLKRHIQNIHLQLKPFQCDKCEKSFFNKERLHYHVLSVHEKVKPFQCPVCGKRVVTDGFLKLHMTTHEKNPDGTWKPDTRKTRFLEQKQKDCPDCGAEFDDYSFLVEHFGEVHGKRLCIRGGLKEKKRVKCEHCGVEIQSKGLNRHLKNVHNIIVEEKLQVDKKKSVPAVHNGQKDHKCNSCGKEFSRADHLKTHISAIHNGQKDHKCDSCGKSFSQAGSLRIHMNSVHNGIKDYKCEYCGKTLSKLQSLQGHIKAVHHKIKDLKCGTCGKMFSHSSALQKHVQDVHLGIRKCTCNICGREYSKPDSLRMHIKHVHDKIRDHLCQYCDQAFFLRRDLRRHIEKSHPNVYQVKQELKEGQIIIIDESAVAASYIQTM